ncbi:hypothetical protein FHU33_2999 [Blastococcus colisei]|uniref:Uncharacterized protein n=1 Tax=Blastococcus colisei TaxID=1564162 RepID=A0A543PHJ0_9ACTN|nr:hypothetical protein [Blastococcus colisei]TQN43550.1 hypothetical protein FHU33_2999 [Blastococcus colisei]
MSAQAFVDESARGSRYHVCIAVVLDGDVDELRRLVRSFCLPGQRRWHFVTERDSRRRQILDALIGSGQISALAFSGKGRDHDLRAESFRRMVAALVDRGVHRLVIESRQGRDQRDRQVLVEELHRLGDPVLQYVHLPPSGDPLLWVADALAWSHSAGGAWRQRIATITSAQDVTGR